MILANFDLSFFTSIPGMLITGGVLLLLIALIIFIATGSKKDGKKNNKEKDTVATDVNAPVDTTNIATMDNNVNSVDAINTNVGDTIDTVSTTPKVEPSDISKEDNSSVTTEQIQPAIDINANESVVPTVDMPTNNVVTPNVIKTPIVEDKNDSINNTVATENVSNTQEVNNNDTNVTNTIDAVTPSDVATSPAVTIVDNSNNNEIPTVEVEVSEANEESKSIYGGSSPVIPKIDIDSTPHRPIYGGANPLENTQSIPTINNTPTTPTADEVKVDIPTVTSTPNVVNPSETVPAENNNTVVSTPNVEIPVKEELTTNINPVSTNEVSSPEPKKEEEIESLF